MPRTVHVGLLIVDIYLPFLIQTYPCNQKAVPQVPRLEHAAALLPVCTFHIYIPWNGLGIKFLCVPSDPDRMSCIASHLLPLIRQHDASRGRLFRRFKRPRNRVLVPTSVLDQWLILRNSEDYPRCVSGPGETYRAQTRTCLPQAQHASLIGYPPPSASRLSLFAATRETECRWRPP